MAISISTLRSNVFTDVFSILNTITDPDNRDKKWIFSSMPDYASPNFVGYPIIVIDLVNISKHIATFDNDFSDKALTIPIEIYSVRSSQLDEISDSVDQKFTTSNFPQFIFTSYDEDISSDIFNGKSVHIRRMIYEVELAYD